MNRNKQLIYRGVGTPIEFIKNTGNYLFGIGELSYELYLSHFVRINEYNANPNIKDWFVRYITNWGIEMDVVTDESGYTEYRLYR